MLQPSFSKALTSNTSEVWTLPDAQHTIRDTLPHGFFLRTRPGDGRCLFHCFQTVLPDLAVEDLQRVSACPTDR